MHYLILHAAGWQQQQQGRWQTGISPGVDGHGLGGIVGLVDAYKSVCQLKHVVSQADDHKLGILCAFLDVMCHN